MSQSAANISRRLLDANLVKTKALPAAAAANFSTSIDLGQTTLGPAADAIEVEISIPATPALVDDKTITLTLKDSADDSTFTAIPSIATLVQTGASSAGAAAASRRFKLPPSCRRYIRLDAAVLTAGGDNTGVSYTLKVIALQ
ncbi:MAG: hypothetical protein IPK22_11215 [Verrucomicrobiaceae bacterium]|nr:hypothetical protein [Verrucomicrobiaceae bacterium]